MSRLFSFDGVRSDCIKATNGLQCKGIFLKPYVKYFSSAFTFVSSPCLLTADYVNSDNSLFFCRL